MNNRSNRLGLSDLDLDQEKGSGHYLEHTMNISKKDHILGHKRNFYAFQRLTIMISDHNAIQLEISNKKMALNIPWISPKIKI